MNDHQTEYVFSKFRYSTTKGLAFNHRIIKIPPRVQNLLLCLLEAQGEYVNQEKFSNFLKLKNPITSTAFWRVAYLLRRALKNRDESIIHSGYNEGIKLTCKIMIDNKSNKQEIDLQKIQNGPFSENLQSEQIVRTALELASARTDRSLQLACSILEEALIRYPTLAIAPSLQADFEISRIIRGYSCCIKSKEKISLLIDHALRINPSLPSALASKGWLMGVIQKDFKTALTFIDLALTIKPSLWLGYFYKAWLLIGDDKISEADEALEDSLRVSPLERGLLGLKAWVILVKDGIEKAQMFVDEMLSLRPDVDLLWILSAIICIQKNEAENAIMKLRAAKTFYPNDLYVDANLAWAQAKAGHHSEALNFVTKFKRSSSQYISPVKLAMIRTALGDYIGAKNSLKTAEIDKDPWRLLAKHDPRLSELNTM
jgi:DNA-binding winged helix-turn-helix (wHTH) protein